MKRSRAIAVGSASASLVAIGWAVGAGIGGPAQALATETRVADAATADSSQVTSGSSAAGSATASGSAATTFDGAAVDTVYGAFQAEITVADGKVTDITMIKNGERDRHSQQINEYAVPRLIQSVLRAQSANVAAISGASFTSAGVLQSVESALQQAGLA